MSDIQTVPEGDAEQQAEWNRLTQDKDGQPQAPDQSGEADAPEGAPGQADTPSNQPDARPSGSETSDDAAALFATADPKLREAFEAERQRRVQTEQHVSTQNGRLSQTARQLAEAQAERDRLKAQVPVQTQEALPVVDEDARKQLADEYPDVAKPLLDVIAGLERTVQTLQASDASRQQQQQALSQLETQRFYAAEEQRLAQSHPDWRTAVTTPEFAAWFKGQPPAIVDAITRNASNIVNADDAILALDLFKGAAGGKTQAKRASQLDASRLPDSRQPAATTGTATEDAEFQRLAAAKDRERKR